MDVCKIVLYVFSVFALVAILLPLIKKDHWTFRIFDYPRLQKLFIIAALIVIWLSFYREFILWYDMALFGLLCVSFLYLGYLILPFTPLGKKMIKRSKDKSKKTLNVLVSNVYQYNTGYAKLLQLVEDRNPDVIFLLETDEKWKKAVEPIKKDYPYSIEVAIDNTYGLLFYSRLEITNHEINYLIDKEVPSIIADVAFDNETVRIYGVHPAPPVPSESSHSTDRDAELLIVGKRAKKHSGPCMVIGDLNDVAWSYTTELFLKISGLLDPRRGRGLYSTFHAKHLLLRWPLDHFFVSSHFNLVAIKVEKNIGSDHFPISICLNLADVNDAEELHADADDKKLAEEKIEAGKNDDPR
jgi:endonuclease/exonuclease/phosphatase (EEP) superfamily protein YafD